MDIENQNDIYMGCLRNHAASLGSYATDGCGEFILNDTSPSTLQCAACGCHRSFHRKVIIMSELIDYGGGIGGRQPTTVKSSEEDGRNEKKRSRTKFTAEQKENMLWFAEKLGWKLQKRREEEDDEVDKFCRGNGVSRQVFKVWMHNHKNSLSTSNSSSLITH